MRKAQIASQFLIVVGFAMVVIAVFLVGFYSLSQDLRKEKQFILVQDLALKIKEEIFLAHTVSEGYSRTFSLPTKLEGFEYSFSMMGSTLIIGSGEANYSTTVAPFNGTLVKGSNIIAKNYNGVQIN